MTTPSSSLQVGVKDIDNSSCVFVRGNIEFSRCQTPSISAGCKAFAANSSPSVKLPVVNVRDVLCTSYLVDYLDNMVICLRVVQDSEKFRNLTLCIASFSLQKRFNYMNHDTRKCLKGRLP